MDNTRVVSGRSDVAIAYTAPRVTPTPPRASRFGEVLSNTVVRSAESVMRVLPGSPVMAVAVRGATGAASSLSVPMTSRSSGPEGPLASSARASTPALASGGLGTGGISAASAASGASEVAGIEGSLQQSQDKNLYYLQLQQEVQLQSQWFTTISNVLKSEHDTVKTAIGNIR